MGRGREVGVINVSVFGKAGEVEVVVSAAISR